MLRKLLFPSGAVRICFHDDQEYNNRYDEDLAAGLNPMVDR